MNKKLVENIIFIVVGVVILVVVELPLMKFTEIITIILGLVGFLALIQGCFGLYTVLRHKE